MKSTEEPNGLDLSKLDWTSQLVMLRDLTARFGGVHEAQVLQLKLWPHCVDTTITKNKFIVDTEGKTVVFEWLGSTKKIDKDYKNKLKVLDEGVKFLFGNDWSITVQSDGAIIYPLDTNGFKSRKPSKSNKRSNRKRRTSSRAR
jgi:hypothetical protein